MIKHLVRKTISRFLTGESGLTLKNTVPTAVDLQKRFNDIDQLGIYLHIPFCKRICSYCPYNKELYHPDKAERYTAALIKEIDVYADIVGKKPVTSFYIGGGTPTTMLHSGIGPIIEAIYAKFNMECEIHMECHPRDLSMDNLKKIQSMGIENISIGVESLQDRHLKTLGRPYTTEEVIEIINQVVNQNFKCVNVDFMFALPTQTYGEIEEAGQILVRMGVNQVAAYPLFKFPYTKMGSDGQESKFNLAEVLRRRKMLTILESLFYDAGFERTSVWAFTKKGIPKYCSVTIPLYIGFGASAGSYLKDIFYLNTFNTSEYIKAFEKGEMAIALSLDLSRKMQMAGWLYWRIYETQFDKMDFKTRFGQDFNTVYGRLLKPLAPLGFLTDDGQQIVLTAKGAYWLHAFEDLFSIDYISTLWGSSKHEPWPEEVVL